MSNGDWAKQDYHRAMDLDSIKRSFAHHLKYRLVKDPQTVNNHHRYMALALSVWDRIVERWLETEQLYREKNVKRVYYLSMEYLLGKSLCNNMINLKFDEACRHAIDDLELEMDEILTQEVDAGLGNGGLGRLAACFLDSMATLKLPVMGYGLRYDYGIFRQRIKNGKQIEEPDEWLRYGNIWEIEQDDYVYPISFGGRVEPQAVDGQIKLVWIPKSTVLAIAYDTPVVGYDSANVNTLRLWSAKASDEFDFEDFSQGDYIEAVRNKIQAENITKVLYPNDNNYNGKELRFRQQYFFVSCSLQDIIKRFRLKNNDFEKFPEKVAIQLNDTHPAMAVAELMRILVDIESISWEKAWKITTATFGYTNHTLLPEALETWPVDFFEAMLPRHLQIIYEINSRFLEQVALRYPGDNDRLRRMSLVSEDHDKNIRMAHLATIGSHSINGVAALHTHLLKERLLPDFYQFYPERFNNKTNGITPRRWLLQANPALAHWVTEKIGASWITNLDALKKLESYAKDSQAQEEFAAIKLGCKKTLTQIILKETGVEVLPEAIFDVHIKRLHEYKRQLLNVLHIIMLYLRLKENPSLEMYPRVFLFAAKAAPGYVMAKRIIRFINSVAEVVNNDPIVGNKIKVVFMPNYSVSLAEKIIPASNVSEQISTAGKEASGTGNMKLALNGALTLGTLDGANIEILEEVGNENIFIFGLTAEEIQTHREAGTYNSREYYEHDSEIRQVIDLIASNFFCLNEPGLFNCILEDLLNHGDPYFVLADLRAYSDSHAQIEQVYRSPEIWNQKAIYNVARVGKFSSDRVVREYARDIWNVQATPVRLDKTINKTMRRYIGEKSKK